MLKKEIVNHILQSKSQSSVQEKATAFAPSNIALCKYWGKRNEELNLPCQSSLSISLANKGTHTSVSFAEGSEDIIYLNSKKVIQDEIFRSRIIEFLDLFRPNTKTFFCIETSSNIPIASGLASSASGFAALVQALNNFFRWQLDKKSLSILARLGSGSACRSLWDGFVEWHKGCDADGMDSYAEPFLVKWENLCLGILVLSSDRKEISSRIAMKQSLTSPFFPSWLLKAEQDIKELKKAIHGNNFTNFGSIIESNALIMHALIQTSWPPVYYSLPITLQAIQKIWSARKFGLQIYFTQDAGPNLILLFLNEEREEVQKIFPQIEIVMPFKN